MQDYAVSIPTRQTLRDDQVRSRGRSYPHFQRKTYHAVMGLLCFSLYAFLLNRTQSLYALAIIGAPWVILDAMRLRSPYLQSLALRVFGPVMRKEELTRLTGNTFYVCGLTFVVLFFPRPVALLSILYLSLGDPSAAIIGTLFGKRKFPGSNKSLEGTLGNFFASGIASFLFGFFYLTLSPERCFLLAIVGGLVSACSEVLPLPFDDNFSIPALSAILLTIVSMAIPLL